MARVMELPASKYKHVPPEKTSKGKEFRPVGRTVSFARAKNLHIIHLYWCQSLFFAFQGTEQILNLTKVGEEKWMFWRDAHLVPLLCSK